MENISIQLKGINRNVASGSGQDGFCGHMVNLRFQDGAWRLASGKTLSRTIESTQAAEILNCSNLLYHNNYFEGVIGSDDTTGDVIIFNFEDENKDTLVDIDYAGGERVNDIKKFGKFLIVATNKTRYIFKWDDETHFYYELPDMPRGQFVVWDDERQPQYTDSNPELLLYTDASEPGDSIVSYIKKMIFEHGKEGLFEGHVFFRFAYRLFDNSLVNHSGIYYAHIGFTGLPMKVLQVTPPSPAIPVYSVYDYLMNNPLIEMTFSADELTDLEKYKGIVSGLELYMTTPVSSYDFTNNIWAEWDVNETGSGYTSKNFPTRDISEFDVLFKNVKVFYKIASYDLDDILLWEEVGSTGYRRKTDAIIIENIHAIETHEAMDVDNFTWHKFSASQIYDYNSRIHLANVFTQFGKPQNNGRGMLIKGTDDFNTAKRALVFGANIGELLDHIFPFDFYVEVDIETEDGNRFTRIQVPDDKLSEYGINIFVDLDTNKYLYLNEIVSYPDIRARYLRVCALAGSTYMVITGFELKEHPHLNLAYYQNGYSEDGNGFLTINKTQIPSTIIQDHTFRTLKDTLNDTNRVQASDLGNPFVYPAINSYRIGQKSNTVVALATTSSPMSEGQFGQFPVHVFTDAGVYNMNQGSNGVLYSNIQRFSLDVLDDKNNLLELGGAVVYVSRGALFLLAGSDRKRISLPMEARSTVEQSDDNFGFTEGSDCLAALSATATISWDSFLAGSIMAFDHDNNELLLSNDTLGVTYAFQFATGTWYLRHESFTRFVMDNSGSYLGIDSAGKMYSIVAENETSNYSAHVCLVTRPMLLGVRGFKKVRRMIGRMIFDVVSGSSVMMAIYGSLNGRDWELLRKVSYDNGINNLSINDLMIKETHGSAKYFILSFGAIVGNDFELTGFDATVEQTFGRKLR